MKCDLKLKRFRLWQIQALTETNIAQLMAPCWDCLALTLMCLEWTWAVLGWFHLFQCFEVCVEHSTVMQTKQTDPHLKIDKTHVKCSWKHKVYLSRFWGAISATCPGDVAVSCSIWSCQGFWRFIPIESAKRKLAHQKAKLQRRWHKFWMRLLVRVAGQAEMEIGKCPQIFEGRCKVRTLNWSFWDCDT